MSTRNVRRINIEAQGLANKITWEDYENVPQEGRFTGFMDISRATVDGNLSVIKNQFNLDLYNPQDSYYVDYNIEQSTGYKYSFKITQGDISYNLIHSVFSYHDKPKNINATYNYSNNSFNITWEPVDNSNILNFSTLTYDVWIYHKNTNNLVKFNTSSTNLTVSSGDQPEEGSQIAILKGTYYFYVTPKFSTSVPGEDAPPIVSGFDASDLKNSNNIVVAPANFILNIFPEQPKDFIISSPYNGQISFSWKHNTITPSKYTLTLSGNSPNTYDVNGNTNTYTLDNTDLANNGLKPGSYSISLKAVYNNIESDNTQSLSFTIPITNIDFTYKLVDAYGVETKNIKNGVEGLIINWRKLSYATYYKITIKEIDQNGTLQNTLVYSEPGSKDNISLKWNFKNSKSKFIIQMNYTTDDFGDGSPSNSELALGEDYLGVDGVDYDKLFVPIGSGGSVGSGLGGGGIIAQIPIGEGL